jgi:hypothetical protein
MNARSPKLHVTWPGSVERRSQKTQALFGWGQPKEKTWREIEREEQISVQQEVLARRKNGTWQAVSRAAVRVAA